LEVRPGQRLAQLPRDTILGGAEFLAPLLLIQTLRTGDAIFLYAYFERASVFCVDRALYFAVAANTGAPRYSTFLQSHCTDDLWHHLIAHGSEAKKNVIYAGEGAT
jgi:hypothetical protein